jgi:peptidoglycan-associated lipoprotein
MRFRDIGLKALCLFGALALAACTSNPESSTDSGSTGGGGSTSTGGQVQQSNQKAVQEGPTPGSQEDLDLNVGSLVFFDFDRSDLKPEAQATIKLWAQWLNQYPSVTVTVEGHCDERGTREYNLGLGERRATSARNFLIALGVDDSRLGTISYGKERPVCGGSNEGCWSQNRRGQMLVN